MSSSTGTPIAQLYIDGRFRSAKDDATFDVRNPFTNDVVTVSASASLDDAQAAVEAAQRAFPAWERTSYSDRRDLFFKAAQLLASEKYAEKSSRALQEETAATEFWAKYGHVGGIGTLKHAASSVNELKGESFPSAAGGHVVAQRRAKGVVYAIAPWNAPIILTLRAIAIPIVCGNTVVLKSSEFTPRTQAIVAELFHEVGFPAGVLNYISTARENAPSMTSAIIANPLVRMVNFTGSDVVGRIIAGEAAKYLKPCVFELGGKAPAVVLDDADVNEAARAIVFGAMMHSGQICMSTERVIVTKGASQALIDAVTKHATALKAGDPKNDTGAHLSAMFNPGSTEKAIGMIKDAHAEGAQVLLGDMQAHGAVMQPHLVMGVKPGMKLWDRESFAPVIGFAVAESVDEAVELANKTDYSLTASLWTRDVNLALDVGARIRAGCVSVNGPTVHSEPMRGHTGLGGATGYGHFAVEHFTDVRMIVIHPAHRQYPLVG